MIKIYTDASVMTNTGYSGISWKIIYSDASSSITAIHMGKLDNNTAELTAIHEALKTIEINQDIELYTDSIYCINLIKSSKKRNQKDMVVEIKELLRKFSSFKIKHIKSHTKENPDQNHSEVDKYAKMAAKEPKFIYNIQIPKTAGNYKFTRREIEDITIKHIKSLNNEKLAIFLSQLYCAKFIWNNNIFNSSIDFVEK